jgi:transposase
MSDAKGAMVLLAELPRAKRLIGDKGYDADWLRDELKARSVRVYIPARSGRNRPATHNRKLYKKRCRIENAFARLKAWRGIATRYKRCGDLFLSLTTFKRLKRRIGLIVRIRCNFRVGKRQAVPQVHLGTMWPEPGDHGGKAG